MSDHRSRRAATAAALALGLLTAACGDPLVAPPTVSEEDPFVEPEGPRRATVVHTVAPTTLASREETIDCYTWTLDNEAPLYVNAVQFTNLGSYHHSNWFVVPDTVYDGPDGAWACEDRDFDALAAAQAGTIVFAQSTQAWEERMQLAPGAVVRIPPHAKIVGERHLLNLAPDPRQTEAWIALEIVHPLDVRTVLTPMQLTYLDLNIPAMSELRFRTSCTLQSAEIKVHYALPHVHAAGNYVQIEVGGDELTGDERWVGFDGLARGRTFDPPLEIPAGGSVRFTCGYDNPFSETLTWGIGNNEMCVALLLVEADRIYNGVALQSIGLTDVQDGVAIIDGTCQAIATPKGLAFEAPRLEELAAPLYVPPGHDVDDEPPAFTQCVDADPSIAPAVPATLDNVRERVLAPWCTFSACHGAASAAGLALASDDLHTTLLEHVVTGPSDLPLVDPGNPDGSWLYRTLSRCEPGAGARSMPLNAPVLLDDATVAVVREWIAAGAPG